MCHFHFGAWEGTIVSSKSLVEICFHGRGGQGAVTAANLLVAAALKDGNKGVQAFPSFGAERRGAPVRAFARVSDNEIHLRSEVYTPDLVIVLDESIMDIVDVLKGLKSDGTVLINTRKKHCKGCGICANECKVKAITMEREGEKK